MVRRLVKTLVAVEPFGNGRICLNGFFLTEKNQVKVRSAMPFDKISKGNNLLWDG